MLKAKEQFKGKIKGKESHMATGSIRKKGKRWYYRFYVEDASGARRQKEFAGTESRSETEQLLKEALAAYEEGLSLPAGSRLTLARLLDQWADEALIPGSLTNGTVSNYLGIIRRIKQYPISGKKLVQITTPHLQEFLNLLSFGGTDACGNPAQAYSRDYLHAFYAVLQSAFRFAVYPKCYLTDNPMQYVQFHRKQAVCELFPEEEAAEGAPLLSQEQFALLCRYFEKANPAALLPVQIAYYTGLRIGEVCGLVWNDIHLPEQYLTVRRSVHYNGSRHRLEICPPKRKSVRCVDFCDSLSVLLSAAQESQQRKREALGTAYHQNFYRTVQEQGRIYYELYHIPLADTAPPELVPLSMVCQRPNGSYEAPSTLEMACKTARRRLPQLGSFHFHTLRHTYTSNLLARGASPKEVQELLGHADIHTTMNIYAHASRDHLRSISRLLDQPGAQEQSHF